MTRKSSTSPSIPLTEFKRTVVRVLPASHPLIAILRGVPESISAEELRVRLPDWLAVLEA